MQGDDKSFDWGVRGEGFYRELAAKAKANSVHKVAVSERTLRFFAEQKERGKNDKDAFEAVQGPAPNSGAKGHRIKHAVAYQNLQRQFDLTDEAGTAESNVTRQQRRVRLSEMIGNKEGSVGDQQRAIEALNKMDAEDVAKQLGPQNDGFSEWRSTRDLISLLQDYGAVAAVCVRAGRSMSDMELLQDVFPRAQRMAPELIARMLAKPYQDKPRLP
jgi:hypothetical protein